MRKEIERVQLKLEEKNGLLWQEFLSQQLCAEPLVSLTPKSTKGSCAGPTKSRGGVIGHISKCELLIEGDISLSGGH